MKLKTLFLFIAICIGIPSICYSQSFLKKAKDKLTKLKENVEKVVPSDHSIVNNSNSEPSIGNEATSNKTTDTVLNSSTTHIGNGYIDPRIENFTYANNYKKYKTKYPNHYNLGRFSNGFAIVSLGRENPFFINNKGEVQNWGFVMDLPSSNEEWPSFSNGVCLIKDSGNWRIIDTQGNIVKTLTGDIAEAQGFIDGLGVVVVREKGFDLVKHYIDTKGNYIFPALNCRNRTGFSGHKPLVRNLSEGLRAHETVLNMNKTKGTKAFGFINEKGTLVIPPKYFAVHDFHEGLAAVREMEPNGFGGKWGFIDKNGKVVIDFIFLNEPSDFNSNKCIVRSIKNETFIINRQGDILAKYDHNHHLSPYSNGMAVLSSKREGVSYCIQGVNKSTLLAYSPTSDYEGIIIYPYNGSAYYKSFNRYALLDLETMDTKLTGLKDFFSDGLAAVADGYVNERGEYIFKIIPPVEI